MTFRIPLIINSLFSKSTAENETKEQITVRQSALLQWKKSLQTSVQNLLHKLDKDEHSKKATALKEILAQCDKYSPLDLSSNQSNLSYQEKFNIQLEHLIELQKSLSDVSEQLAESKEDVNSFELPTFKIPLSLIEIKVTIKEHLEIYQTGLLCAEENTLQEGLINFLKDLPRTKFVFNGETIPEKSYTKQELYDTLEKIHFDEEAITQLLLNYKQGFAFYQKYFLYPIFEKFDQAVIIKEATLYFDCSPETQNQLRMRSAMRHIGSYDSATSTLKSSLVDNVTLFLGMELQHKIDNIYTIQLTTNHLEMIKIFLTQEPQHSLQQQNQQVALS